MLINLYFLSVDPTFWYVRSYFFTFSYVYVFYSKSKNEDNQKIVVFSFVNSQIIDCHNFKKSAHSKTDMYLF